MVATRHASVATKRATVAHSALKKAVTRSPPSRSVRAKASSNEAKIEKTSPWASKKQRTATVDGSPLLDLGELVECELLRRPSARNKSPYVADVKILSSGLTAIAHCPNLDSGGKCVPGTRVLCSRQSGVSADTVGPFGTPKCELVIKLLRCHELEHHGPAADDGVWVSAHPALTESLTLALIKRGALDSRLSASPVDKTAIETQRCMKRLSSDSSSGSYRPDYRLSHLDGSVTILEVKQVVDTDYDPRHVEARAKLQAPLPVYSPLSRHSVESLSHAGSEFTAETLKAPKKAAQAMKIGYQRSGIFPWGKRGQKGPDGQKVVSARAIDHIRELAKLAETSRVSDGAGAVRCAILFVCGRSDVMGVRPNGAACPTFAKYLESAREKGLVTVLCHRVRWGQGAEVGKAYDDGAVPLMPALAAGDGFISKA
jgi:DNA-binding sugar fermentation-stimulating protein